jgi:hypothetical protein
MRIENKYRELFKFYAKSHRLKIYAVFKEQCDNEIIEFLFYIKYNPLVKYFSRPPESPHQIYSEAPHLYSELTPDTGNQVQIPGIVV